MADPVGKPQTIILEKNIAGKHEKSSDQPVPTNPAPNSPLTININVSRIKKAAESLFLLVIIITSLVVAIIVILNALGIIKNTPDPQILATNSTTDNGSNTGVVSAPAIPTQPVSSPIVAQPTPPAGRVDTGDPAPVQGGISTQSRTYTYVAYRGDGVTHLARRAMLDYLAANNIQLTRQQKLFFETTLTQRYNPVYLEVGQTRTFAVSDLDSIVHQALNLTARQQRAWNKYLRNYPVS